MNPEYQEQARRLNEIRTFAGHGLQRENGSSNSNGNAGENGAWNGTYSNQQWADSQPVNDPLIYQGVYAPSGFNLMDILLEVYKRPNPQIHIGNVDSAVALVLCDAETQDHPILYCSEPFENLTGYSSAEVIGHNCRFLQHPPGGSCSDRNILQANSAAKREVKHNISRGRESRVRFTNFKKDGTPFANILTLVPIVWEGKNYIVGFQADEGSLYR
ncbi:PAS domain-containing protein [Rhexocercosporidium sp. MPI-PUGE-AT-0058]|nr:PAS domain-containing protein [Rhexocercosporidium sp. MPI-PUGE-AT-0058]